MKRLLLTLSLVVGSTSIHGMELQEKPDYMGTLPSDAKICIISALNNFNKLEDVANAIQATSFVNVELNKIVKDMYGNQNDFKTLMHELANRFYFFTKDISRLFKTPTAEKYRELCEALTGWCSMTSCWIIGYDDDMSYAVYQAAQLIAEDADVNCNRGAPLQMTLTHGWNPKLAKLLLDAGAKPEWALNVALAETGFYKTGEHGKRLQTIRQLIEDAIKK